MINDAAILELLFEQTPMAIAVLDRDLRIVRCNTTWVEQICRYAKVNQSSITPGMLFFDLLPDTESVLRPYFERALQGEMVSANDVPTQVGTVSSFWEASFAPLMEAEQVVGILNVTTDATQLHHSLAQTQESNEQFRLLFEKAQDGNLLLDDGLIIDCNPAAVTLFGMDSKESLVGLSPHQLSPATQENGICSRQLADDLIARAHQQGSLRFEWIHQRPDGTLFPVEVQLTVIPQAGRQILHVTLQEISTRVLDRERTARLVAEHTLEVQRRAEEVQTLLNVQQAATSRLDPQATLQLIADEARRLTSTEMSTVSLLNEDELEIRVVSGSASCKMVGRRISINASIAGMVVTTRQPCLIADTSRDSRNLEDAAVAAGATSLLVVPLLLEGDPIGTITVANRRDGALKPADQRILTMLASGVVAALENARLYEREQERRRIAEGLQDILRVLNSSQTLAETLKYIAPQACSLLDATSSLVRRIDHQRQIVYTVSSCSLPEAFHIIDEMPYYQDGMDGPLLARQPIAYANIHTVFPEMLADKERVVGLKRQWIELALKYYQSQLVIPLFVSDLFYGTLTFYYEHRRSFSSDDQRLAMALGEQISLAIETADLRLQLQQTAVAAERNRLARELHDAVTQTLFSASMIADVLPRIWEKDPGLGREKLVELRDLTRGALAEMRTLLLELRPATLTETSLGALLKQLTLVISTRSRIPVELKIYNEQPLPAEIQVALYRIAQESLNNMVKHAGATAVGVDLSFGEEGVRMIIRDNGRGFSLAEVGPNSLGLSIMRERAEQLGLTLKLESTIGEGTVVSVDCKLEAETKSFVPG